MSAFESENIKKTHRLHAHVRGLLILLAVHLLLVLEPWIRVLRDTPSAVWPDFFVELGWLYPGFLLAQTASVVIIIRIAAPGALRAAWNWKRREVP